MRNRTNGRLTVALCHVAPSSSALPPLLSSCPLFSVAAAQAVTVHFHNSTTCAFGPEEGPASVGPFSNAQCVNLASYGQDFFFRAVCNGDEVSVALYDSNTYTGCDGNMPNITASGAPGACIRFAEASGEWTNTWATVDCSAAAANAVSALILAVLAFFAVKMQRA